MPREIKNGLDIEGEIVFGGDSNLYRGAANRVQTDDVFQTKELRVDDPAGDDATVNLVTGATGSGAIKYNQGGSDKWFIYQPGGADLYARDMVNSKMHLTLTPGAGAGGNTEINSALNVKGTTDLDGTLNVDGAATLNSTLAVTGDLTARFADGYAQKTVMIESDTAFYTASTSTGFFAIAGLTNGPTSGFWPAGTYEFQADCYFTTSLATPLKFAILCRDSGANDATFTAGTLDYNVQHWKYTTSTGAGAAVLPLKKYVATFDEATATTANVATTETIQVFIKGKITLTEPATFLVRAGKTSASSGTLTCLSGSYLTVNPARL